MKSFQKRPKFVAGPVEIHNAAGGMKRETIVVDSHNKVLSAWADHRRDLGRAPRLLTLDRHTDTSRPFRKYLRENQSDIPASRLVAEIDFNRPETVERAVSLLGNDEHVVAAIESGIVSSALVLAHNARDTDLATYRDHRIVCREVRDGEWDRVIESEILARAIEGFGRILGEAGEKGLREGEYILDIDLDYFTSFASIAPSDETLLRSLAEGAGLITVATEPEYVRSGAVDPGLTSEYLLGKLERLMGLSG